MIVCHCNRISKDAIEGAVECLKSSCPTPDLCPENVYGQLDACPRCCRCFPLAEKVIEQAALNFVARDDAGIELTGPTELR